MIEKLIKLTDVNGRTRGGMQWAEGVTHEADTGLPPELCSEGVLHAYRRPEQAVFLSPAHVDYGDVLAWEVEGEVAVSDCTKVGCRALTVLKRTNLPEVTTEQRMRFAIACVYQAGASETWKRWAVRWLCGEDRSRAAARAAAGVAAEAAAWAAAWAAEGAADAAAGAAADAAARAAARAAAEAAAWAAAGVAEAAASENIILRAELWALGESASLGEI